MATLGEFLHQIQGQIHSLESPEEYDALSSDVIRPAFSYHTTNTSIRPQIGPGSASISSVNKSLSPISPFTESADLRREVDFTTSTDLLEGIRSVMIQVQNVFYREGDTVIEESKNKHSNESASDKRTKIKHASPVSAQKSFVSLNEIADLTLGDIAVTFQYSIESSKLAFNEENFFGKQNNRMKKVIVAMRDAVAKSRSKMVKETLILPGFGQFGDVDALKFCAAMRIFAEWRILRQVPDGYRGYALGMNLGHKDIVQNIAKIEQAVHNWIDYMFDETNSEHIESPTLRDLLQYEINMNYHPQRPYLENKSGSMGILWVCRQLHYQTLIFSNILQVPRRFSSMIDAVTAAYQTVYGKYHGWAMQQIFNYSFQSAPDGDTIYRHMNPHRLKEVLQTAKRMKPPIPVEADANLSRNDDIGKEANDSYSLLKHIDGEWNKLVDGVFSVFGGAPSHPKYNNDPDSGGPSGRRGDELENFVSQKMTEDCHEKITAYLEVVDPLLEDLAILIETLNIDDPTKV